MEINDKEAAQLRDQLHNLSVDNEVYLEKLYYIIASGEGFSPKVYGSLNILLNYAANFRSTLL